jgi:two-component system, sensor histidine kinase YesM
MIRVGGFLMIRKGHENSFERKLFYRFIIIGMLPLIIMAAISYGSMSVFTRSKLDSYVTENLEITARLVDSTVTTFTNMTNYIADNREVQSILVKGNQQNYDEKFNDTQQLYKTTRNLLATQTLDVPIHITDKRRWTRFSTTDYLVPIYEDSRGNFYDIMDKSEGKQLSFIHRRVDGKDSKDIVMAIGRQVRDTRDGEPLGYVISDVYEKYFDDILNNSKIYKQNNIYVLDKDGIIITDKLYKNRTGFKFNEEYFNLISKDKSGGFECSMDDNKWRAYFTTAEHSGLKIVELIPMRVINNEKSFIITTFIILIIVFSILAVISSYGLSASVSKPVRVLSALMRRVEAGDRNVNFELDTHDEIGHLGKSFNDMVKEINRLIEEVYMKQYLLQQSEFKALKAQVNPHFLYNTLQSIDWMAKLGDCQGVSTMVKALGKFLRYSINKQGDIVTVKEEIEQVQNYLTIQKIRYRDKFEVVFEVEESIYESNTLRFLLQPIVENAIVHGLEPKIEKGRLIIKGFLKENNIVFEVIDDGVGPQKSLAKGEGIGIENVDKRIKINYGDEYGVFMEAAEGETCVRIIFPNRAK